MDRVSETQLQVGENYLCMFTVDADIVQWKIEQNARRKRVKNSCVNHNISTAVNDNEEYFKRILVDDKHKVLFCAIPKAGCTSWKALLLSLLSGDRQFISQGREGYLGEQFHGSSYLKANGLQVLTDYPVEKRSMMLSSYTKIIAVRDPLDRLLSAYRDKLLLRVADNNQTQCKYCDRLGREIIRRYRKNATEYQLHTGRFVTPLEFLKSISEFPAYIASNLHFKPYHNICQPCAIQYDYIIKMETSEQDNDILIPLVFNSKEKLPVYHQSSKEGRNLETIDQLSKLTLTERKALFKIYSLDYESFGYNIPTDK